MSLHAPKPRTVSRKKWIAAHAEAEQRAQCRSNSDLSHPSDLPINDKQPIFASCDEAADAGRNFEAIREDSSSARRRDGSTEWHPRPGRGAPSLVGGCGVVLAEPGTVAVAEGATEAHRASGYPVGSSALGRVHAIGGPAWSQSPAVRDQRYRPVGPWSPSCRIHHVIRRPRMVEASRGCGSRIRARDNRRSAGADRTG